jgi:hypothetical protein
MNSAEGRNIETRNKCVVLGLPPLQRVMAAWLYLALPHGASNIHILNYPYSFRSRQL